MPWILRRGCCGLFGEFGAVRSTVRCRTVREVGRYIGSYNAYSIGIMIVNVEFCLHLSSFRILIKMDSEADANRCLLTPDEAIHMCRTKINEIVFRRRLQNV
jgi:hypothetical protein